MCAVCVYISYSSYFNSFFSYRCGDVRASMSEYCRRWAVSCICAFCEARPGTNYNYMLTLCFLVWKSTESVQALNPYWLLQWIKQQNDRLLIAVYAFLKTTRFPTLVSLKKLRVGTSWITSDKVIKTKHPPVATHLRTADFHCCSWWWCCFHRRKLSRFIVVEITLFTSKKHGSISRSSTSASSILLLAQGGG